MKPPLIAIVLFGSTAFACQVLDGDHIRGADLAAASPAFAALDPAEEIGNSPLPGIQRVFHPADLLRLAHSHGIELATAPAAVCFERSAKPARATGAVSNSLPPLAVHRGDKVDVTVSAGGILLRFQSEAESSGRSGDTVIVLNPENGNRFVARVENQGKVMVKK